MGSFSDFMAGVETVMSPVEGAPEEAQAVKNEAELYLEEAPVDMAVDILVWWGHNELHFPNLARMAAQFLGCPAASASCERVFSLV